MSASENLDALLEGRAPAWFLHDLWRGGPHWAYWCRRSPKNSAWLDVRAFPVRFPVSEPEEWRGGDVWFNVNPLRALPPPGKRGGRELIARVNALFVDLDGLSPGAAVVRLLDAPLFPTALVATGGGVHAYWMLHDPCIDLVAADALQKAWVLLLGGDSGAKDIARMLRLPGSLNTKYAPPRPVVWLEGNQRRSWSLREVVHAARPVLQARKIVEEAAQDEGGSLQGMAGASAGTLRVAKEAREGNRNALLYWAACRWADHGVKLGEAEGMARDAAQANGLPEAEALRTCRSAYNGVANG